jgi:hypothetical protein
VNCQTDITSEGFEIKISQDIEEKAEIPTELEAEVL